MEKGLNDNCGVLNRDSQDTNDSTLDVTSKDAGNKRLTLDVLDELLKLKQGENLIFSPIGIHKALEILQRGTNDDSLIYRAIELLILFNNSDVPEFHSADFALEKATSLWIDKSKVDVKDSYIKEIEEKFNASVFNKDFNNGASVKSEIDSWVNEKTHQAIQSLDFQLSPDAFMVLLDSIYMKAKWKMPFKPSNTIISPFSNIDDSISNVWMMHQTISNANYEENEKYQSICLPYADGHCSMVIVLPKARADFDDVIINEDWMHPSIIDGEVELSLPKFKFDVKVNLENVLRNLGLWMLFDSESSFPKISEEPTNVSQFFQQCTIAVDEKGTEAAAVTVVEWKVGCCPSFEPRKIFPMNVNRPFGFAVKYEDEHGERILFAGVVKQLDNVELETSDISPDKDEFLSNITVAGTTHIKDIERLSKSIEEETQLRLVHEKDNLYDHYAVGVYFGCERVGYVPKGENELIANLLDAGKKLQATVTSAEWVNGWFRINADIEIVNSKEKDLIFTVEPAKLDDAEYIAQFQLDMALESEGTLLDYATVLRGVSEGLKDQSKGIYFVARNLNGEIISSLMITKEWSDWHCEWYWWIQSVYVKPEYRRKGVYRRMYETVKEIAKESNVTSLRLYVDKTNSQGLAVYNALGMKESHYLLYEECL